MLVWNGSSFKSFSYANGAWSPFVPVLGAGESAFVSVPTNDATTISCPANITVASCTNVPEFYAPAVTNTCCGTNITVVCTPPSGSYFVPGTTTPVNCTVIDCNGVTNSCSFTIMVECSGSAGSPVLNSTVTNQVLHINWNYLTNWALQDSTDLVHWTESGITGRPPVFINISHAPPAQYYRLMFHTNGP